MDDRRRRGDAHGEHRCAEERVHEGGLAVVELAEDNQVEALVLEAGDAILSEPARQREGARLLRQGGDVA